MNNMNIGKNFGWLFAKIAEMQEKPDVDISEEKEENGDSKLIAVNWAHRPDGMRYGPFITNRKYIRSLHSQMGKRIKRKKAFTMGYHSN